MNSRHRQSFDTPRPKVSVIMPAYNGEQYIAQSIQSVLKQTFSGLELIIIDDGSGDRTAEIIANLRQKDNRILYFRQENAGQANARNKGISKSRGDLIGFLDQDDIWIENKLELQIKEMNKSQVDLVFSNGYVFTGDDIDSELMLFPTVEGRFSGTEMFRLLFMQNRIPVLTALVRREALIRIGPLDEDSRYQNSDDYDLWLRLASHGADFLGLPDMLVRYRSHPGQASKDIVRMLVAELAVLRKHEQTELVNDEDKSRRFASLYGDLILSLVDERRFDEARACMRDLRLREGFKPTLLARAALLKVRPGSYRRILEFLHRAQASLSYRVARRLRYASRGTIARPLS